MRRLAFVVLAAMSFLVASPALAHWENTRWGMSRDQIRELYPNAVPEAANTLASIGAFSIAGHHYSRVVFHFGADGGLRSVTFRIPSDDAASLQANLVRLHRLGNVLALPEADGGGTAVYFELASGDDIALLYGTRVGAALSVMRRGS